MYMRNALLTIGLLCICSLGALSGCGKRRDKAYEGTCVVGAVIQSNLTKLKAYDMAGFDLNAQDTNHFNWTPLIASIYYGHSNITFYLIQRGVDVCVRGGTGNTALMQAIQEGDTNTGRLLIEQRGAELKKCEDWSKIKSMIISTQDDKDWKEWSNILHGLIN